MPIKWRSKIILAKIEAVYGTDSAPAAGNGILARNVSFEPMAGEDVSRELERPYLGAQPEIPTGLRAVLAFETELQGSGAAGTPPAWGVLARGAALSEVIAAGVSVTYAPVSDAMESVSIYFWTGDTRHVLLGCRGTGIVTLNAQGIPVVRWTFTGLWAAPSEQARVNPNLAGFIAPAVATKANTPTFTVDGVALVLRSFTFDFGNQVEPRLLIGREEILIVDKAEAISAQVEAVALTTFHPLALAQAQTQVPVSLVHGTAAGRIVTLSAPAAQLKRLSGYENNQDILEWPLRLAPLPDAGNDQFSITLT